MVDKVLLGCTNNLYILAIMTDGLLGRAIKFIENDLELRAYFGDLKFS